MRNSIQGPLLRTGNNSSFKALGETGYPYSGWHFSCVKRFIAWMPGAI